MKKRDSDKNPFEKKNLRETCSSSSGYCGCGCSRCSAGSSGKEVTAETREVVNLQIWNRF